MALIGTPLDFGPFLQILRMHGRKSLNPTPAVAYAAMAHYVWPARYLRTQRNCRISGNKIHLDTTTCAFYYSMVVSVFHIFIHY